MVTEIIPFLQKTQTQHTGNAEIGPACLPVEDGILILIPEENGKDLQPKQMSPERLQELYDESWEIFYREKPQSYRMFELFKRVIAKEMADGTFRRWQTKADRKFGQGRSRARSKGHTTCGHI